MKNWLRQCLVLFMKELRLESRGRELAALLFCHAVLMAALVGAGASSAIIDTTTTSKIFPMLFWIVFLFSTTGAMVRSNEYELEGRGFEGLLLCGITGSQLYVSKVLMSSIVFFVNFALSIALVAVALGQDLTSAVVPLAGIGFFSSVCLASLLVLLSAVASTSRLKGVMLPLISLPLLFPLFFIGVEMTTELMVHGAVDATGIWPTLLACATVLYLLVGINVFEEACRE